MRVAPLPRTTALIALSLAAFAVVSASAQEQVAKQSDAFAAYTETIPGSGVSFDMVPIEGGRVKLGSPEDEPGRGQDESPQADVAVGPFWMSKHEVTWDEYERFALGKPAPAAAETTASAGAGADAVTRPTPPYADPTWGFGKGKQPALGMTWHAAAEYCRWLSAKTGHRYRLPTEAEWEYAARAGSTTPWSSGKDPATLAEAAWTADNSNGRPHPVSTRKPNAFGLYDMHGNVAEWTLDRYDAKRYATLASGAVQEDPVLLPGAARYPHVVRGGSFEDDAAHVRSAARRASKPDWSRRDPQLPQSIWWHTDAIFVGFRVARAVEEPAPLENFKSKITRDSPDAD
jgi:formylglycine-generating enzyme required for sulfatase activity